ncbi:MAG: LacI family DNA-binding transcriptional regulator [Desulfosarcinaceae bacterium]|nr:LacI family DNA-binding transcriptional regulator [Desulfosarcinaceae bacterium]
MPKKRTNDTVSSVDVARLAGVSQAAVSRTYTPGASISEKMRQKVLAAAEQLGYQPNIIARSLSGKATRLIGIVMVKIGDPFYARILAAFSRKLQEHGYWSLLLNVNDDLGLEEALPQALQYQVDGIVLTSATLSSPIAARCAAMGVPVVMFNRYSLEVAVNSVGCDHAQGARDLADFLLKGGHRRMAYIAGEENSSTNQERERGFTEGLAAAGQRLFARESGDYSYAAGFDATGRLLARPERPDAIFCANDWMAIGAIDQARQSGLKVPEDLSVVGFDDAAMAAWPRYSLTTINQPIDKLVMAAVEVLVNAIESPTEDRVIKLIPGRLVVRNSARLPVGHKKSA